MKLPVQLRKRFGHNSGVHHIELAAKHGSLKPFTDVETMGEDLKTFVKYHEETDPKMYRLATGLHALNELIAKVRDQDGRAELSSMYNSKLGRFGSDPLGKAQELLLELQDQLTEFGSTR